jgi:DNA gyrase/topoisomerase IV subunit B
MMENAVVAFSSTTFDREEWLRRYLGVSRPFAWEHRVERQANAQSSLTYDVRLYYSKAEPGFSRFGMVNSVPIDSLASNHLSVVVQTLTRLMAKRIPSKDVQTFFVDSYRLPVYMAVEVKYEGAEFTSTTKTGFTSADFREEYGAYLTEQLTTKAGTEAIDALYELLAKDIEDKYIAAVTGQTKSKVQGRLFQDLNFPKKFTDCNTTDRTQATLFIVEGDSAGGGIKDLRDGDTMGLYTIRGKPYNALTDPNPVLEIQKDPIYQDIIRIVGLNPRNPDLNGLYFDKIVVLTDAD